MNFSHVNCKNKYIFNYLNVSGVNCSKVDHCAPKPCRNQGECHALDDGYQCNCLRGYKGDTCMKDVNECVENPDICQNGGTCDNRPGSYM